MIRTLVVLGASGDLTGRYLLPAMGRLHVAGLLGEELTIVDVDRHDLDDDTFRTVVRERLAQHAADLPSEAVQGLSRRLRHRTADVTDAGQLSRALTDVAWPAAFYLALPNAVFLDTVHALAGCDLPEGNKLVVEKPFGAHDDKTPLIRSLSRH